MSVAGLDHWVVFNVGDSRVYRLANDALAQVTVDHSEVTELVAAGEISAKSARTHPHRNVVTRSLGTDPAPNPDLWVFPPTAGERFLICSDGLTLELDDTVITDVLTTESDAQRAAETLVQRAVSAGGRDNVTAIVVDLESSISTDEVDEDTAPRMRDPEDS